MTAPWVTGELVDAPKMYNRIQALIAGLPQGIIGEQSGGNVTLATTGTQYIGDAFVTVVVPTGGRRYRALVRSTITSATVPARYLVTATYNPGATIDRSATAGAGLKSAGGSITPFGAQAAITNSVAGSSGAQSAVVWGTVFLAAGTYTFTVGITRNSGGAATDNANSFITLEDIGAV